MNDEDQLLAARVVTINEERKEKKHRKRKEGRKEDREEGKSIKHEKSARRRVCSIGASIKLRMHAVSRVLMNERLVDEARGQRLE